MNQNNIAILDTDFISKLHTIQNKTNNPLMEKILELPFQFHCHRQALRELEHNERSLPCSRWLIDQGKNQKIKILSDLDLINRIRERFNSGTMETALNQYRMFLQESCYLFSSDLYKLHYFELDSLEPHASEATIGKAIYHGDESVGTKNNLGEIKAITMIHIFIWLDSTPVFQFLSDDSVARRSLIQDERIFSNIHCISALGSFYVLLNKNVLDQEEAREFFESWMEFHKTTGQSKFKIQANTAGKQVERIEGFKIFQDLLEGSIEMRNDGMLRYR